MYQTKLFDLYLKSHLVISEGRTSTYRVPKKLIGQTETTGPLVFSKPVSH